MLDFLHELRDRLIMQQHNAAGSFVRMPQCALGDALPAERLDALKSDEGSVRKLRTLLFAPAYNEEGRIGKVVASVPRTRR